MTASVSERGGHRRLIRPCPRRSAPWVGRPHRPGRRRRGASCPAGAGSCRRAEPAPARSGTGHGRRLLVRGSLVNGRDLCWLYRSVGRPVQPPLGFPARIIPCRGDQFPRPLDHHLPSRRRWKRPKPRPEFERDRPVPLGAREDVRALHTSPVRAVLFDAERRCRSPCIVDRAGTNPFALVMSRLAHDGSHPLRQHDVRWRRLLLVATTYPPYSWGERVSMPSSTTRTDGSSSFETTIPTTRSVRSRPRGIVSPTRQFVTVLLIVGGSAGVPSVCSNRNWNAIRFSLPSNWLGPNGSDELSPVRAASETGPAAGSNSRAPRALRSRFPRISL
jgi:hypothetical protein